MSSSVNLLFFESHIAISFGTESTRLTLTNASTLMFVSAFKHLISAACVICDILQFISRRVWRLLGLSLKNRELSLCIDLVLISHNLITIEFTAVNYIIDCNSNCSSVSWIPQFLKINLLIESGTNAKVFASAWTWFWSSLYSWRHNYLLTIFVKIGRASTLS